MAGRLKAINSDKRRQKFNKLKKFKVKILFVSVVSSATILECSHRESEDEDGSLCDARSVFLGPYGTYNSSPDDECITHVRLR